MEIIGGDYMSCNLKKGVTWMSASGGIKGHTGSLDHVSHRGCYEHPTIIPHSPPQVERIWLWVYLSKTPIYPIFYLLKGDHKP